MVFLRHLLFMSALLLASPFLAVHVFRPPILSICILLNLFYPYMFYASIHAFFLITITLDFALSLGQTPLVEL